MSDSEWRDTVNRIARECGIDVWEPGLGDEDAWIVSGGGLPSRNGVSGETAHCRRNNGVRRRNAWRK